MLDVQSVKEMLLVRTRGNSGGANMAGEGTEIFTVDGICLYCVQ